MHGLQLRARVDAELVGEPGPQRLVGGERVGLPPGGRERPHQQPGELLVQWVLRDERLKLAGPGGAPARVDLPGEEGHRCLKPQLLEAAGERLGEVPGVRERGPAPQRQRLGCRSLRDEPLEAQRVHVIGRDGQPVPGRRLLHGRGAAQRPAGPGYQGLQRVSHVGRRLAVPDGLGERAGAHRLPARQRQPGDEAAQPRARHGDDGAACRHGPRVARVSRPARLYCARGGHKRRHGHTSCCYLRVDIGAGDGAAARAVVAGRGRGRGRGGAAGAGWPPDEWNTRPFGTMVAWNLTLTLLLSRGWCTGGRNGRRARRSGRR